MSKGFDSGALWAPRSVEETLQMYADWAAHYERDVGSAGYETPARLAAALADAMPDQTVPVLDFGCGTGLSGMALAGAGFPQVDGTDISPEMLAVAREKPCYRKLWQGQPGEIPQVADLGYGAVTATGVISLGAAPPETLADLLSAMPCDGLLGLSYNDPTLNSPAYMAALEGVQEEGLAEVLSAAHGPHLSAKDMGSTVYVLRRL